MTNNGQITAAARLRQLLSDSSHTVVAPGVYDGISARLALAQGFECLYMVSENLHPRGDSS
jgi:2-methylisocitrate lyase-like PEP mutase family enzyme